MDRVRYVAIGDSFTEGVGDEDAAGTPRGWADRVAAGLAGASGGPVSYANLAVRGRLLDDVVGRQLDAALALDPLPTMVTLNGGGNDMLRPRSDLARLRALTASAVRRCADAGVRLVLLSGADPSAGLPMGRVVHRRAAALTGAVADLAGEHGLTLVDAFSDTEIRRPGYWSPDRLHLGPAGHVRVAGLVLDALGVRGSLPAAGTAPDAPPRAGTQLAYYREHVLPWVGRRLRGRSSGDGRPAKYPDWTTVPPTG
ncbi:MULTISPECIES: SGNH/GDSL hydrolase family protein [unclassified Pseudonocardia]|uniref:SGNH/GDSL hydrolase family protein n=1 Tax=unclassified Pseudonocardia TaxID=2619320 RepID=UPI000963469C|nr:SGNH/GDSL hydrolase family protein [Pseudonocardia sp. Ae707_Ps1]OLM19868.1 putative secreted protein [Pseudonocardia sp. Ae707_Ps1]